MQREEPAVIRSRLPRRIDGILESWVHDTPDAPAVSDRYGSWSYAQLAISVSQAAILLKERGVRAGDRVLIVCENCREAVAMLLASSQLDAWPVMVDGRLALREIKAIREHCSPAIVVVTAGKGPAAETLANAFEAAPISLEQGGRISLSTVDPEAVPEPVFDDPAQQVGAMLYTSGSTGKPKGVMLSHRGLMFVAAVSGGIRKIVPQDRFYGVMPLSHSVGLTSVLLCALMHGASVHLAQRFNPAEMMRAVQDDGLSVLLGTPALYSLLAEYAASKGVSRITTPALRIVSASGSPLDMRIKTTTEALFGLPMHHGYGATECSPTIAQVRPESPCDDLSVGPLLPGMEARFRNPVDGVGELQLRGPNLMLGYYRSAAETKMVLDEQGWFSTGDLAMLKGENLYIVGRCKDIIIRNGFNIYPAEIEAVLNAHPGVVQSAVIGIAPGSGNGAGEEIIAHVEKRDDFPVTEQALLQHAATELASYKMPSRINFLSSLPMLPSGKVDKRALL